MEVLTKVKPRYGITHPGKCHPDESLCGAIIHLLFGDIPIYRRQPTEAELDDPTVFVFDTGGSFNPKKNNFDHHQNKTLPAACLLMWDRLVSDKGPENKALKDAINAGSIKNTEEGLKKLLPLLQAEKLPLKEL